MTDDRTELHSERHVAKPCKAMEAHRDGRGLWAFRACYLPSGHTQRHTFGSWNLTDAVPVLLEELAAGGRC